MEVGVAEPDAARLGRSERGFGARRDHARLLLGHGSEDVHRQPVHLRHVGGDELDAAFHQPGHEVDVAGQAVELGDHQHGAVGAGGGQRRGELGTVAPAPALHFDELGRNRATGAGDVDFDGGALRVQAQAQAAAALLVGADAVVGDKAVHAHGARSGGSSSPGSGGCPRPARAKISNARAGLERAARAAK